MKSNPVNILLVENDRNYASFIRDQLVKEDIIVEIAYSPEEAISKAGISEFGLCITGERLQDLSDYKDRSGIELVKTLAQQYDSLKFIVNSDFPTWKSARELLPNFSVIDYLSVSVNLTPSSQDH